MKETIIVENGVRISIFEQMFQAFRATVGQLRVIAPRNFDSVKNSHLSVNTHTLGQQHDGSMKVTNPIGLFDTFIFPNVMSVMWKFLKIIVIAI